MELRRPVGDGGGPDPRRPRPAAGDPHVHVGASSTAAPTASPSALLRPDSAEQDKVAQYLYNAPEYLESIFAAFKVGFAAVNTNYRYTADELVYLWDNADVVAVVFHGAFVEQCEAVRPKVPRIRTWLWVDDGTGPCPDWATPYEAAAAARHRRATSAAEWGRSGDHLLLLYTGGTTGMPKGVMWRQDDLFGVLDANNKQRMPPDQDLDAVRGRITKAGPRNMPAAPLDARHRPVQRDQQPDGRRQHHHDGRSPFQRRGVPRLGRSARHQLDLDRRRRVRQADPAGPRRRTRTAGTSRRCG